MEIVLPYLPKPLPGQIKAITTMLLDLHEEYGLQNEDLEFRKKLADRLNKFVKSNVPGCHLNIVGSSVTGLGLKSSKVDLIFKVASEKNIPDSLELLYKILLSDPAFDFVVSEFRQKFPGISFYDKETNLKCNIILENHVSGKLAKLLNAYCEIDPRVRVLGTTLRYWAKFCAMDCGDEGTLPSYSYALMLVYFLQQIEPPVLPVLHEDEGSGTWNFYKKYLESGKWKTENTDSIGELWIKFFYFYNFTYQCGKEVICIRSFEKQMISDRIWLTKFYAIEDPFMKRNVANVIPSFKMFRCIENCFMRTYQYFAHPQLKKGGVELIKNGTGHSYFLMSAYYESMKSSEEDYSDESASSDDEFEDQNLDRKIENMLSAIQEIEAHNYLGADGKIKLQNICSWDVGDLKTTPASFCYKMEATIFRGNKGLPYSCKKCKSTNHSTKNCPRYELLVYTLLPQMSAEYLAFINKALFYVKKKNAMNDEIKDYFSNYMAELQEQLRKHLPDVSLTMFGSFCNGFGFVNHSDMDFCVTFKGQEDTKSLDCTQVIENLAEVLKQCPNLENVTCVTTAKIPIVKFHCKKTDFNGDVSLYNKLGIANTQMLEVYSKIDERVQILGYAMKFFAKKLGICDAYQGGLSSYAYILMVIFFLQQCDPPVVPVLQELPGEEKPSHAVDGRNTWFFRDLDRLAEVWPYYGRNTETVGELWIGLLNFYTHEFDLREYVISIRQKAPLTRFKKLWMTSQIAIEDPFDLDHNLGHGVTRQMKLYIFKAFDKARIHFGTPISEEDIRCMRWKEVSYLFNKQTLTSGIDPPVSRCCWQCGELYHKIQNCSGEKICTYCKKTGHLTQNCPRKSKHNAKQNQQDYSITFEENPVMHLRAQPFLKQSLRQYRHAEMRR